jgi:hypothetical protein
MPGLLLERLSGGSKFCKTGQQMVVLMAALMLLKNSEKGYFKKVENLKQIYLFSGYQRC